jgi:hypothetical protein
MSVPGAEHFAARILGPRLGKKVGVGRGAGKKSAQQQEGLILPFSFISCCVLILVLCFQISNSIRTTQKKSQHEMQVVFF